MRFSAPLLTFFLLLPSSSFGQQDAPSICPVTSSMTVYSNASYSPESGDVSGYEVALAQETTGTHALLFVYEGVPNETGIELTAENTGQKLTLTGIWTEHLIEYPSRKETTQTHPVHLAATVSFKVLKGSVTIDKASEEVRLKRTGQIWLCRNRKR